MDYRPLITKILGEHSGKEGEVALRVLSYVAENPDWQKHYVDNYQSKTLQALSETMIELYGHPLSWYSRRDRHVDVVKVRQYIFLFLRENTAMSLPQIGDVFGMNHATVMWGIERAKSGIAIYDSMEKEYNNIKNSCLSKL